MKLFLKLVFISVLLASQGHAASAEITWRDYVDTRFDHVDEKFKSTEKAVDNTAVALKEKLAEMNQFRAQLDRERSLYVTRDMLDALLKPIQTKQTFDSGAVWMVGIFGALIGATIPIAIYLTKRKV